MTYTDYSSLLSNRCSQTALGLRLNSKIFYLVFNYLNANGYGSFNSPYAARKVVNVLSFKPSAKIFQFNGSFYVVDFRQYKILKTFVSYVCSLDFSDNDIDFSFIQSYFNSVCAYFSDLNERGFHETILNPSPIPDFVDDELPF